MEMPSGRRSSAPSPMPTASGIGAEHGGDRGHHDRAEAQQARLVDRLARATCPRARSASRAKSIIRIAFFFTMPISRITPISAMIENSVLKSEQRQQRAHAGRGQRREDGDRVDRALVEHAQHDVDGEERREDQQRLVVQALLEEARRALERRVDRGRRADARHRVAHDVRGLGHRHARLQVERDRGGGEGALVVHRQRRQRGLEARDLRERHRPSRGREHVDPLQRLRALAVLGRGLHDHRYWLRSW